MGSSFENALSPMLLFLDVALPECSGKILQDILNRCTDHDQTVVVRPLLYLRLGLGQGCPMLDAGFKSSNGQDRLSVLDKSIKG